jgi:hypothetical protein
MVSAGDFWPSQQELSRYLKYMTRTRIPEFESDMPSHAVGLSQVRTPTGNLRAPVEIIARAARHPRDAVRLEAEVALFRDRTPGFTLGSPS